MIQAPRRYPHRAGKTYTVRGFPRVLRNLEKSQRFTPAQRRNLTDLYFGRKFREFLDDEGFYRRSRGMWRVGRVCKYAYRIKALFDLVERSGIFHCCYNDQGQMIAFRSEATWRLQGGQQTLFVATRHLPLNGEDLYRICGQ